MTRPSRFLATSPQPLGHSRHTVEKYAGTPGTMLSGGTTYGSSVPAEGLQPPAAAAAPVVATTLKNDRRSITLIQSSALLAMAGDAAH